MEQRKKNRYKRHVWAYGWIRRLAMLLFRRKFAFTYDPLPADVPSPYLVVANHNTNYDPALISMSFRRHMYFVSSAHVLHRGLGAWLLKTIFAPISRLKGGADTAAAMGICRALRAGANVCLFVEGNRSFDGHTGPIHPTTGKMVKAAGCTLVTYKFEGGYLSSPRWSYTLRRGKMKGYPVAVYAPAELANMSAEQINARIGADLYEDAFARQALSPVRFKGARLAEGLETALFLCPRCGGLGTLRSRGGSFFCACGLRAEYTEEGFFLGAPFPNVFAWSQWQSGKIAGLLARSEPFFSDAGAVLEHLDAAAKRVRGVLSMGLTRLCVGDLTLPMAEISDMALVGRGSIVLVCAGRHMQINGPKGFCGRKYLLFYRAITQRIK